MMRSQCQGTQVDDEIQMPRHPGREDPNAKAPRKRRSKYQGPQEDEEVARVEGEGLHYLCVQAQELADDVH